MSTRSDLLMSAETLLRTKGYSAFSYADLADEIGIKKASIHHHFPTKEGLAIAVVESYLTRFRNQLQTINDEHNSVVDRLTAYASMFTASSKKRLLPLCGALAAELLALPESLKEMTKVFFEIHLNWLQGNIKSGRETGELKAGIDETQTSRLILNSLEGGSFVSWALNDDYEQASGFHLIVDSLRSAR
ncbi:TetR/AcrR family transcriptional regulator [Pseudomonas syringae]|uniref:TetR/AcrR family transcriptional regulator n=1 Tax=Pseudomonas syringae TaxID=317 RepID=UPI0018E631AC|nr:TetR/AcrR family transcriptional regulator [Pseudomonas syringae]MBI6753672.1 TetR/AcrR family transcriptional regulator [Pseudomonas syringae]MBI6770549.1 TetR/AcrR family transcriptional regulator [Pseudomonas syringae]MBI6778247.1 TetR/AcrR family transcriptional regulator [Pseudomonas syringae]MBI6790869.1 TetR/AcrR family transcriptional regulator [Pseudomonas syringae]MBI6803730.1 TetR/AcrR family transcriptional regulator [Pseudomonas syringae]